MSALAAAFGAHALAGAGRVTTPDPGAADALRAAGLDAVSAPLATAAKGGLDAVGLLADELSLAGERAESLVAEVARVLRPGGMLAVTAVGARFAAANGGGTGVRTFTAAELTRLLGLAGFDVTGQWAPGAARLLGGGPPSFDPHADRTPGLLDAAPQVAAAARRYPDHGARERAFFASLPRKVVAAAVLCRDARERVLVVHDVFKQHWTIPGGVVDADEDPRAGAARETREETGVSIEVGALLGLFALSWPDRLVLVYDARPVGDPTPRPLHSHEIDAAEWLALGAALARINPRTAEHVRRCLEAPGGTWHDAGV